jgi:hypothetical protein
VHKVSFNLIVPLLVGIIIGPQVGRFIFYTPSYFLGSLTSFILSLRNGQNVFWNAVFVNFGLESTAEGGLDVDNTF